MFIIKSNQQAVTGFPLNRSYTKAEADAKFAEAIPSFTTGSVPFADSTGQLNQDNANFFWDDTNDYLKLGNGTSTTSVGTNLALQTVKNAGNTYFIGVNAQNTNAGTSASTDFVVNADNATDTTNYLDFGINSSGNADASYTLFAAGDGYIYNQTQDLNIGTASAKALKFFTGGTLTANERMRIDSAGLVGIGTTAPGFSLDVSTTVASASRFSTTNTSTSVANGSNVILKNLDSTVNNYSAINFFNSSASGYAAGIEGININHNTSGTASGELRFVTNNAGSIAERVRIDKAGNVGINATAPASRLYVGGSRPIYLDPENIAGKGYGVFIQGSSGGAVQYFGFVGSGGTALNGFGALTSTDSLTRYFIGTYNTAERLTVLAAGNVGINEVAPGAQLQVTSSAAGTIGFIIKGASSQSANLEQWQNSSGTVLSYINSSGQIGIGSGSGGNVNLYFHTSAGGIYGVHDQGTHTGGTTGIGFYSNGTYASDVTGNVYGVRSSLSTAAASFTLSNSRNFYATDVSVGSGSTVTNQMGFEATNLTSATNNYGFVGGLTAGSNKWNLYMSGTAVNYMQGQLTIGNTATGPTSNKLLIGTAAGGQLNDNLVGLYYRPTDTSGVIGMIEADYEVNPQSTSSASFYNFYAQSRTRSSVVGNLTGQLVGYYVDSLNSSATYSVTNMAGFQSGSLTNSGGGVTNYYGFRHASVTAATNNYGFYTSQTSGATNWAFYGAGTAKSYMAGIQTYDSTVTAGGTTGNQTINKPSGTVNFATAATSITVTNSMCSTTSIVVAVVRTNDTTAYIKNVVPASGSFTINLGAAATAETSVGFIVYN